MNASADDFAALVGPTKAAGRIRAAAVEVFAEKGYGAATTREIAARVGLSPGAVYPHYKTKESLLFAISLEGHNAALLAVTQADGLSAPTVRLTATVTAYVKWHAEHHALAKVVQHELRSLSREHFKVIVDIRRSTSKVFKRIIEAGDASGDFRTIDVEAATLAITSLGVDVSRWFPSNSFPEPVALATRYSELALRMVGAATSHLSDDVR